MEQPPPIPTAPPTAPAGPVMPLYARFLNIFAVPSAVFETVKLSRVSTANWLLPFLLTVVAAVASSMIVAAQPAIQQLMKDRQEKQVQALKQEVQAGKVAEPFAKAFLTTGEIISRPHVFQFIAGGFGLLTAILKIFGWAMALWLLAIVFLKTRLRYAKALEVAGLAGLIGVLGMVVPLLLQVNFSNPAASPGLVAATAAAGNFDAKNPMTLVLLGLNLCELWQLSVLALGLARLTNVPFTRAGFAVFSFWLVWMSGLLTLSALFGGMGG